MKKVTYIANIDKLTFNGLVSFDTESTWDKFTDTCVIELPKKLKWQGISLRNTIKRMQKVTLLAGYDNKTAVIFDGYVRDVLADIPMKIFCEDKMFLLKQYTITKSYENISLINLLKDIISKDISFVAEDILLGKIRINKATPVKVFDMLKSTYGINTYYRNDILFSGIKYRPDKTVIHKFRFYKDIIDNNLVFRNKEDTKIKVTAISINQNTKVEYETGDNDGEQHTFYFYNVSEATLKQLAKAEIEKLKYDGYTGSFTTFGNPLVKHGDIVEITDEVYNRNGKYLVKSVKLNSTNGYRQIIEIDRLV